MIEFGPVLYLDGSLCTLNYCTCSVAVTINVDRFAEREREREKLGFRAQALQNNQSGILLIIQTPTSEYTHQQPLHSTTPNFRLPYRNR